MNGIGMVAGYWPDEVSIYWLFQG